MARDWLDSSIEYFKRAMIKTLVKEGFDISDARRLNKPIVRFIPGRESNCPEAFKFNIAPDNLWLNMRFPQTETDANHGIVDNEGGTQPKSGDGETLRDGVTD